MIFFFRHLAKGIAVAAVALLAWHWDSLSANEFASRASLPSTLDLVCKAEFPKAEWPLAPY
jgi:hypothetical protein